LAAKAANAADADRCRQLKEKNKENAPRNRTDEK
jgi:hypothetical protein